MRPLTDSGGLLPFLAVSSGGDEFSTLTPGLPSGGGLCGILLDEMLPGEEMGLMDTQSPVAMDEDMGLVATRSSASL